MRISSNWFSFGLAAVMASSIATLSACGAQDGSGEALATAEQAIIPGAAITQYTKTLTLPPNGALTGVGRACPTNSVLVGGGHFTTGNVRVHASMGSNNGWYISVINLSATTAYGIDVYVECLSGTNATSSVFSSSPVTVPASMIASQSVQCPDGTMLTGGGYSGNTAISVFKNYPTQVTNLTAQWNVHAQNKNSVSAATFQVQAVCLTGGNGKPVVTATLGTLPANGQLKLTSNACPPETLLSSGGYNNNVTYPTFTVKGNLRNFQTPTLWNAVLLSNQSSPMTASVWAVCLELWP